MIIPVRCISCGTPIGGKWEKFRAEIAKGKPAGKVLDDLGITRYCCRALFLTHVDLIDEISKFKLRTIPREEEVETKARTNETEEKEADAAPEEEKEG